MSDERIKNPMSQPPPDIWIRPNELVFTHKPEHGISHKYTRSDIAKQREKELKRERDLAIAHDRQPYPTAEAYEKVCEVLHKREAELAEVEQREKQLRKALEYVQSRLHKSYPLRAVTISRIQKVVEQALKEPNNSIHDHLLKEPHKGPGKE